MAWVRIVSAVFIIRYRIVLLVSCHFFIIIMRVICRLIRIKVEEMAEVISRSALSFSMGLSCCMVCGHRNNMQFVWLMVVDQNVRNVRMR